MRACAATASDDARSLRLTLLDEIRRVVAFDAYAWLLTDPETEVGSAPLADVPCLPELPRLIRLKYLTPINRWTQLQGQAALLSTVTDSRLGLSLVWRELLAAYDVNDVASLAFRCRHGCWGFLDLWRYSGLGPFTDTEAGYLTAIAKPITEALRRCQAATFTLPAQVPVSAGPAVLVLSPDLTVRAQTSETDAYLKLLLPPGADRLPIPAGAYNVAAQLLAVEAGIDDHAPRARVHLSAGLWLTLRAARIGDRSPTAEQDIAVTIEASSPTERMTLFARAFALSPRESELLGLLVAGADTRRIAQRMFLSEHTVQDHLKAIFSKCSATNRRTLLARLVGL